MAEEPLVSVMLPGKPMGKKRHRARVVIPKHGKPWVQEYPDPDGVAYEADLAAAGRLAMAETGLIADPFDGPLTVFVEAFVPIPASWSKKDHAAAVAGEIFPVTKPDGDNYAKIAGDALNKVVWVDDSQIIMWQVLKLYSDFPRLRVSVWAWNDVGEREPALI
jgi:Holliday junction resolvase RusA-like endonuclease